MSKELITKETIETAIKGGESIVKVAGGLATDLMNEAINLFIMESILGLFKVSSVFIVFYILKKYSDTIAEAGTEDTKRNVNSFKTFSLLASIIFFTAASFPHIQQIGKVLVAPKIFLLEKAKGLKGK